eukprot:4662915-Lingulodinium_polyedra.AAC.1
MRVPKGAQAGAVILVQCAESETAAVPADMPHWTPPPAMARGVEPTARWGGAPVSYLQRGETELGCHEGHSGGRT